MPSKTQSSRRGPARGQRSTARPSKRSASSSRKSSTSNSVSSTESEDDASSDGMTPSASRGKAGDAGAPSAGRATPVLQSPKTVTGQSRGRLAGSTNGGSNDATGRTATEAEAVHKKMLELTHNGWVPEEETRIGAEEDDDDQVYNAVDDISESDDDESAMRRQEANIWEQKDIARRLSLSDNGSDVMEWNGFDEPVFNTGNDVARPRYILDYDESRLPAFLADSEETEFPREPRQTAESQRRVRFEDEIDGSDVGSTDTDEMAEIFPDIFLEPHQLGHSFHDMNNDETYLDNGSDAGSVFDFDGEDLIADDDEEDSNSYDSYESSGDSDSDDGDTTDEEVQPPPRRLAPSVPGNGDAAVPNITADTTAAAREMPPPTVKKRSAKPSNAKQKTDAQSRRVPKVGTFELDPRRAVLVVDGAGITQRNTFYPAQIQTEKEKQFWSKLRQSYKNRTGSPRTSVHMTADDDSDELDNCSALFSPEASSMFTPSGTLMTDSVIGPPEAFTPFTSIDASGAMTEDTSMASASDEEEDVDPISPFINFDAMSDGESRNEDEDNTSDTPDVTPRRRCNTLPSFQTPSFQRQSTQGSDPGEDLWEHLTRSRGLVHSFRNNQQRATLIASHASDPAVRASTHEMNAMQSGRRKAGNTPITPMRKKRGGSLSRIGKVDWSKGLSDGLSPGMRESPAHYRKPSATGRGVGKWGPSRKIGLFR